MEKAEFTIEKSKVECYKIRHPKTGMFWADITLDVMGKQGRISISSDFGNYANFWGACGSGFKNFLTELNIYYAADKFGADRWFDMDSTIEGYKRRLLEYRRDEGIDSEKAREIFDEIKELESCSGEAEFVSQMWNSSNLMRFYDYCPDMDRNVTPQFRKFWETVWPVFIDQLKQEIESENDALIEKQSFNGELVLTLESKREWINKVPRHLPEKLKAQQLIWLDVNNNCLTIGEDFAAAEEMKSYPVRVYRINRVAEVAEKVKNSIKQ